MTISVASTASVGSTARIAGSGRLIVGDYATIEENVLIDLGSDPNSSLVLEARSKLKCGTVIRLYGGSCSVGARTSIGEYSYVGCHGGITIGQASIFGPFCILNAASHIIDGLAEVRFLGETARGIKIADDVWLGARVTVLDGVSIGGGAVVGAHSLVNRSILGNLVYAGTPVKIIRTREKQ
jgi:acetyltransferase-like isoleucine patch superfamily enzyme